MDKASKQCKRIAEKDSRIESYEHDQDGHWFWLAKGYKEDDYGAHGLRADSAKDLLGKRKLIVKE